MKFIAAPRDLLASRFREKYLLKAIATVSAIICTIGIISQVYFIGWSVSIYVQGISLGLLILSLFLIHLGKLTGPKIILSIVPIASTFANSVISKLAGEIYEGSFYDYRFVLIILSMIPILLIPLRSTFLYWSIVSLTIMFALLFDPIHNLFGIGYYQLHFEQPNYYYINVIAFFSITLLIFGLTINKWLTETFEAAIGTKNKSLESIGKKLKAANHTLLDQKQQLVIKNIKLTSANSIIDQQNFDLVNFNKKLRKTVHQESLNLIRANQELMKKHTYLMQFSYTLSHSFRSYSARIIGLANILKVSPDKEDISKMIHASAHDLNESLSNISRLIETDSENSLIEKILLPQVMESVEQMLPSESEDYELKFDFNDDFSIYTIRPILESILFNIISNSISNQAVGRRMIVTLHSYSSDEHDAFVISIRDNGSGIDLQKHGSKLFKIDKVKLNNQSNTGLGLFLVKSQMDALAGKVEVDSTIGVGTVFRLFFAKDSKYSKVLS